MRDTRIRSTAKLLMFPNNVSTRIRVRAPVNGSICAYSAFRSNARSTTFNNAAAVVSFTRRFRRSDPGTTLSQQLTTTRPRYSMSCTFRIVLASIGHSSLTRLPSLVGRSNISDCGLCVTCPNILVMSSTTVFGAVHRINNRNNVIGVRTRGNMIVRTLVRRTLRRKGASPRCRRLAQPQLVRKRTTRQMVHVTRLTRIPICVIRLSTGRTLSTIMRTHSHNVRTFTRAYPRCLFLSRSRCRTPNFRTTGCIVAPPLHSRRYRRTL